jgi:hypothetical protein
MKKKSKKNPAAVKLGRAGGIARWANSTPEERIAGAQKAARARWKKARER